MTTYHSDGGPAGKASPLVSHQAPPITRLGSGSYGHHRTPSFGHEHTHQQHEHSFPSLRGLACHGLLGRSCALAQ